MSGPSTLARGWRTALAAAALAAATGAGAQTPAAPDTPPATSTDSRKQQDISFPELPSRVVTDGAIRLAAKASSGLTVTYELVSGPAALDGRELKLSGATGLVVVRASQAGNDLFRPADPQERAFVVNPKPVAPALVQSPTAMTVGLGDPILLEARASGEPLPTFQWRKNGQPIDGARSRAYTIPVASLADAGAYDVLATNSVGSVQSPPAMVAVTKRHQSISFFPPSSTMAGQAIPLSAMASSGLPVHFEVIGGTATVTGTTLTASGTMVTLVASQPGDDTFEAATPVTQTIMVQPVPVNQGQHF